jgi:hypothetical protein
MPLFNFNFQKKIVKIPEPVLIKETIQSIEPVPVMTKEIKKKDVKPKLLNKIKVKNDSKVKLTKKTKEIHISENEDSE